MQRSVVEDATNRFKKKPLSLTGRMLTINMNLFRKRVTLNNPSAATCVEPEILNFGNNNTCDISHCAELVQIAC